MLQLAVCLKSWDAIQMVKKISCFDDIMGVSTYRTIEASDCREGMTVVLVKDVIGTTAFK